MHFEIEVRGYLGDNWFEEFELVRRPEFTTLISGCFADQAALYGALRKINDMGMELISVKWIGGEQNGTE